MKNRRVLLASLVALAVLLLALPIAACGQKTAAPTREVRIGIMGGQTGPAAAAVNNMIADIENTFKYINNVENGVSGAKLSWRIVDDKGTTEGSVLAYKELRESYDPLFYIAVEDYCFLGVKDMMVQDKATTFTLAV